MVEELASDPYGKDKYLENLKVEYKRFHQKDLSGEDYVKSNIVDAQYIILN
jgi:hypothetical protein